MNACRPPLPPPVRRPVSVLVGLFAAWQLVYLPAANLIAFVPLRPAVPPELIGNPHQERGAFTSVEPLQRTADGIGRALEHWSELSGQEQGWSLFAPGPPPYSVFVAAELQWADGGRETLRSRYEPGDPARPPWRAPVVHSRHYHFEAQLVCQVWYASPDAVARDPAAWAGLPARVGSSRAEIRAWLAWQLNTYCAAHPHREPPVAVVLKHRYISTPDPGAPAGAPRTVAERPFARWRVGEDEMDAFDVVTMRFRPLGAGP